MTTLVRPQERGDHDLEGLRSRVAELETLLGERRAGVAHVRAELNAFTISYRQQVGSLHEQLEQLELEIAEAELGELSREVESGPREPAEAGAAGRPEPPPRYTSDAVRRLFRDVAKVIHPDLARDESARDRRHALMVEANRAYALGDEEQLRSILRAWEQGRDAQPGTPGAMRLRLVRRVSEIEAQLAVLAADLATLQASPVWALKGMVDEAAARGKDLVRETIARLQRDIMVATNRLDAMRPPR